LAALQLTAFGASSGIPPAVVDRSSDLIPLPLALAACARNTRATRYSHRTKLLTVLPAHAHSERQPRRDRKGAIHNRRLRD
jgi:hypothetical protein